MRHLAGVHDHQAVHSKNKKKLGKNTSVA